jgi:hypothetical protein
MSDADVAALRKELDGIKVRPDFECAFAGLLLPMMILRSQLYPS